MKTKHNIFIFTLLLAILLSSCNLPRANTNQSLATAAALTVQAALTSPSSVPISTSTGVPIVTQPSSATLTLTDNTNCRSGPGTNFERLTLIPEGTTLPILARSSDGKHWLVKPSDIPDSCWVLGELGKVSGDTSNIPQATSTVGENSGAPARPGSLFYNYECTVGSPQQVTTTLTWGDAADNENGYRLYRYDSEIAELPANSTQYVDETTVAVGGELTYSVEAFNENGASPRRTISFTCGD